MDFLAIDFETADYQPDSACSIGLVRVSDGVIVHRTTRLIRPPRPNIVFTHIHGLAWEDVEDAPTFGELWPEIKSLFEGVEFLVAHNASFDQGVLAACCRAHRIPMPRLDFHCTVKLSRKLWGLRPANLPAVCRHFNIPLNHHDAGSDTEACARIMIEALKTMGEMYDAQERKNVGSGVVAVSRSESSAESGSLAAPSVPAKPKRIVLRRLRNP